MLFRKKRIQSELICITLLFCLSACSGVSKVSEEYVHIEKIAERSAIETEETEETDKNEEKKTAIEKEPVSVHAQSESELLITLPYARITHSHLQGGLYDGHFFYQTNIKFDKASNQENNETYVLKYDMQAGETVAVSECLQLGHSNDIAYNPDTGEILVVCNKPFYDKVGVLDPDTLELVNTVTLPVDIFCLDYATARKQYAAGISGGQSFVILNEDFEVISPVFNPSEETAGYTTQGCCCDENYIYFLLNNKSVITVYDWNGNYVKTIDISVAGEPENISVIDGEFYIMSSRGGAAVYKVTESTEDQVNE